MITSSYDKYNKYVFLLYLKKLYYTSGLEEKNMLISLCGEEGDTKKFYKIFKGFVW